MVLTCSKSKLETYRSNWRVKYIFFINTNMISFLNSTDPTRNFEPGPNADPRKFQNLDRDPLNFWINFYEKLKLSSKIVILSKLKKHVPIASSSIIFRDVRWIRHATFSFKISPLIRIVSLSSSMPRLSDLSMQLGSN